MIDSCSTKKQTNKQSNAFNLTFVHGGETFEIQITHLCKTLLIQMQILQIW